MISCHDNRSLDEIRGELLGESPERLDIINTCIVLCDRIMQLENKIKSMEKSLNYATNTASCLANGIIPD